MDCLRRIQAFRQARPVQHPLLFQDTGSAYLSCIQTLCVRLWRISTRGQLQNVMADKVEDRAMTARATTLPRKTRLDLPHSGCPGVRSDAANESASFSFFSSHARGTEGAETRHVPAKQPPALAVTDGSNDCLFRRASFDVAEMGSLTILNAGRCEYI